MLVTSPHSPPEVNRLKICNHIILRLVEPEDAEWILSLRLDPRRNQHLSQVAPDLAMQREWLQRYKEREKIGAEYYFSIESEKSSLPFGTLRLYDFQGDTFCWGSWIIKPGAPLSYAVESSLCAREIGFFVLGFKASRGVVSNDNVSVIRFHRHFSGRCENQDGANSQFRLSLETYLGLRKRYQKFFRKQWLADHAYS